MAIGFCHISATIVRGENICGKHPITPLVIRIVLMITQIRPEQ